MNGVYRIEMNDTKKMNREKWAQCIKNRVGGIKNNCDNKRIRLYKTDFRNERGAEKRNH